MGETYRTINTRFWSDGWIRNLNALDRYLFLYLITNEHVNWCGIYELEIGMMAFESGIDKEDLQKTMLPRLLPKVIYHEGWIFIKNFPRYHTGGINAEKGLKAAMDALPTRIKAKIRHILGKNGIKSNPLQPPSPSASASASASASKEDRFAPPSLEELTNYCKERKNGVNASQWMDFYISKGWFIGKNKMRDWKAAVRTWESRNKNEDSPVITIGKKNG